MQKLNIETVKENDKLSVKLAGGLDTATAPELSDELQKSLDGITELTLDLEKLEYISSAGLRVLLSAQKTMNDRGTMKVVNVGKEIMEIFDVTGFVDILTIEQ